MPGTANNVNGLSYIAKNGVSYTEGTPTNQVDQFRSLGSPYMGYMFPSSTAILLQSRQVSYAPNTLGSTTHIYTSPIYQDIIDLARYFADWSCGYTIQEGSVHTITVTCPWDTVTSQDWNTSLYASEQWELLPNQGSKELKHAGLIWNPFNNVGSAASAWTMLPSYMKTAVDIARKNDTALNLNPSQLTSAQITSCSAYIDTANCILQYYKMGVEGVPSYTQTLKRTAVIDKRNKNQAFNLAADATQDTNSNLGAINYVISTQTMRDWYSLPPDGIGKFLLPSYSKQLNITSIDPFSVYTFAGWLVKPASFQFIGQNKVQLTQEFVWDEWLGGLYYMGSPRSHFTQVYTPP